MIRSCKKPPVYFESTTGSFYSQYAGLPLKSCRVDLPVNQSGSGTPSPTNIRDFIPYSSLDFTANSVMRTFTFGQNVYIGYLDILTGELTVTHGIVDLGTLFWYQKTGNTYNTFYCSFQNDSHDGDGLYCSNYETSTYGPAYYGTVDKIVSATAQYNNIFIVDDDYTSVEDFKVGMNGVQLVYKLKTPITIPLGGMEINTILGLNNLISSVGTISAEYLKAGR